MPCKLYANEHIVDKKHISDLRLDGFKLIF